LGENKTCIPNHTARFSTTPTTAAVMPERVVESFDVFPELLNVRGAEKINRKQGRKVK